MSLDQSSVSAAIGAGKDFVRDILRGKARDPGVIKFFALADELRVSPQWLLGGTDAVEREPSNLSPEQTVATLEKVIAAIDKVSEEDGLVLGQKEKDEHIVLLFKKAISNSKPDLTDRTILKSFTQELLLNHSDLK